MIVVCEFAPEMGHCCGRPHHYHRFPERGWLQFLLLRLLYEKPMHGYQLMEELNGRGFVQPGRLESGSVYTILRRMEHRGLLSSEWDTKVSGPDRRVYRVSEEGVEALRRGLEAVVSRKRLMDELASFYREHFGEKDTGQAPGDGENKERR